MIPPPRRRPRIGPGLTAALAELADCDVIVIDTPGSDTGLSRIGHARADILITPLNDSFLDLDLLARLDREGKQIKGPSIYAEAVWEQRKRRALADGGSIDWVVMRNRLSSLDARNKRDIGRLLEQLAKRIGFRLAPGFSERVIFRELFPRGLTLLDLNLGAGRPGAEHVPCRGPAGSARPAGGDRDRRHRPSTEGGQRALWRFASGCTTSEAWAARQAARQDNAGPGAVRRRRSIRQETGRHADGAARARGAG